MDSVFSEIHPLHILIINTITIISINQTKVSVVYFWLCQKYPKDHNL